MNQSNSIHQGPLLSQYMNNPTKPLPAVPVSTFNKSLPRTTTPSRRRRIIYETARRITRQYLNDAFHSVHCKTNASLLIQFQWRRYQHSLHLRYQNAIGSIRGLYFIYQAKKQLNQRRIAYIQKQEDGASTIISLFFQKRRAEKAYKDSSIAAVVMIQSHWRGTMARNIAQEFKLSLLEMECSAIVIQSSVRSYLAKVAFARRYFAPCALLIQRQYRLHLLRRKKREKMMVEAAICTQLWWRKMNLIKRLMEYALEEIRLRSLIDDNSTDGEDGDLSQEMKSNWSNDDNFDAEEGDDPSTLHDPTYDEEKDDSKENDLQSDSSSFTKTNESENDGSDSNDDDELSTSTSSTSNSAAQDRLNRQLKEAMELEHKQNKAASVIQFHLKLYVNHLQQVKRDTEEQLQLQLLKKQAAMTITRELWNLYQLLIQRREQAKRQMETRAVINIQTRIRSFLAIRFVRKMLPYLQFFIVRFLNVPLFHHTNINQTYAHIGSKIS